MRGQAFVSFPDADAAQKAQKEVNRFPLYGKPMVRRFRSQIGPHVQADYFSSVASKSPSRGRDQTL